MVSERVEYVLGVIIGKSRGAWEMACGRDFDHVRGKLFGALMMAEGEDSIYIGWIMSTLRACRESER